jgi:hypothetical protein
MAPRPEMLQRAFYTAEASASLDSLLLLSNDLSRSHDSTELASDYQIEFVLG